MARDLLATPETLPMPRALLWWLIRRNGIDAWAFAGADAAWRIRAEKGPLRGLARIGTGSQFAAATWRLRSPYIEWIAALSSVHASPAWWASELAAKNPYTLLFARACELAVISEVAKQREGTLFVVSTPALLEDLADQLRAGGRRPVVLRRRPLRRAARALIQRLGRNGLRIWSEVAPRAILSRPADLSRAADRALAGLGTYRRRALPPPATSEVLPRGDRSALLATWVDDRNFSPDGSYRDPFLGPLPEMLRARGWDVVLLPRILPNARYRPTIERLLASGERLVLPHRWLDGKDERWCRQTARRFTPAVDPDTAIDGVRLSRLARQNVDEHRRSHADSLSYLSMVRNLAAAGASPQLVVHPFEGHAWEQAFTSEIRRHWPRALTVGADMTNFSRLMLSLFPSPQELDLRPLPDRVVTCGSAFEAVLVEEGYPAERVRRGCALRHTALERRPRRRPGNERATALVATGVDFAESCELVDRVLIALGDVPEWEVIVKCHPAVDVDALDDLLGGVANRGGLLSEGRIGGLIAGADVMFYTYTVTCYEAIARGVSPIFVPPEGFLALDKLEPFPEVHWLASTADELRAAAREARALSGARREEWEKRAREVVDKALAPVSDDCVTAFLP